MKENERELSCVLPSGSYLLNSSYSLPLLAAYPPRPKAGKQNEFGGVEALN